MSRLFVSLVVIVMLLSIYSVGAYAGEIVNGSFEDDGWIDDITVEEPNGWDVNMPGNFGGWVYSDWVTDGSFNLTVSSFWYTAFEANDVALVSQQVILKDVKRIIFDVKLDTYPDYVWDPNKRTAAVLIGDEIVWVSDVLGEDVRGEYFEQVIDVNVNDDEPHILSLALIADVNEEWLDVDTIYYADWDYIGFDCRGMGVLPGDFNRDCVVNEEDLRMLTEVWLNWFDSRDKYNLYDSNDIGAYGIINFRDYAVFADVRDSNDFSDLEAFTDVWLDEVPADYEWNLYKGDDVWPLDIIDFLDVAVFAENWLVSSYD